jgi:argininosuccinate synthase
MSGINKIVLAFSGGLDTSVILRLLEETYQCEVITFTADLGQPDVVEMAREKAISMGIPEQRIHVEDLREEFARDYIFPMFRANTVYEGEYLLGTSIARPLIAKRLVELAHRHGADAISHGATGKGNDQVRFELSAYALDPDITIIAPWREWSLNSRANLLAYARDREIPIEMSPGSESPFSMDANLLHISYEGGPLEDPWKEPPPEMWRWTADPGAAPDQSQYVDVTFQSGDLVAVDGVDQTPGQALSTLNDLGATHGIGRIDIVENRYVGIKSRGAYETPGGTILMKAHRALESITLDREVAHLKDNLMPRYAEMIYNGYWLSPERMMLQEAIDHSQIPVTGTVKVKLYKGSVTVVGRRSDGSLFDEAVATFEDDAGIYTQSDATGFIRINALRLRNLARKRG